MGALSVHKQIVTRITALPLGSLIFPAHFLDIGSESAIKMSLSRLAKNGRIERVARGIYTIPKMNRLIGKIHPSIESIAMAIAERDKVKIKPTGLYALNRLGLSTQVPTNYVYITDGTARSVRIGRSKIKFKASVPKKLATKGPISGLVIQALEELGPNEVTPEILKKLTNFLEKEEPDLLKHDATLTSAWIARILYAITSKEGTDRAPAH